MRRAGLSLALVAMLAACERAAAPPSPTPSPIVSATAPPPPIARAAPVSLAGEWRIAAIDGKPFDEAYGLALSADARKIWWEPVCAGFVRGYRIEGERIVIGPDPDLPPRKAGDPTRAICTIGPPSRLADVMRALDTARTVRRTPANGIELAGGGHSLVLFSQ